MKTTMRMMTTSSRRLPDGSVCVLAEFNMDFKHLYSIKTHSERATEPFASVNKPEMGFKFIKNRNMHT